ncbi:MAG: molybdenum cofactor guanylyltransferase MobA, partial [Betaproteobacteria bacterium]
MTERLSVTGVVLAGGMGRRMGGVDKGLLELRGRPLAAWVVDRLRPQVDHLLINANQNRERYAEFGCPVVADEIPDFAGPLAGLHAALSAATTPLVATAPCDSPFLPETLVSRLFSALTAAAAD